VGALKRRARYPSDASDRQWELIEPLLPPVNTDGWPEKHSQRAIVDAILYVVRTGYAWWQLPADFPPWHGVLVLQRLGTGQGHREDPPGAPHCVALIFGVRISAGLVWTARTSPAQT
jgi:transposase